MTIEALDELPPLTVIDELGAEGSVLYVPRRTGGLCPRLVFR